jgi:hypothetical protein
VEFSFRVFGDKAEPCRGVAPDLLEVRLHGRDTLVMQLVDAARAAWAIDDESGRFQQLQVPRNRRSADRQGVGDLSDRAIGRSKHLEDGSAVWIAQRVEWIEPWDRH